jgi:hypothetical protein
MRRIPVEMSRRSLEAVRCYCEPEMTIFFETWLSQGCPFWAFRSGTPWLLVAGRLHNEGPHNFVWFCSDSTIVGVDEHEGCGTLLLLPWRRHSAVTACGIVCLGLLRKHRLSVAPCGY